VVDADIGLAVSAKQGGHPAGNLENFRNRKWSGKSHKMYECVLTGGMLACIMWWTQKWWYYVIIWSLY